MYLDALNLQGKTILLDIDGTLTTAGSYDLDDTIVRAVERLRHGNAVHLLSNKRLPKRNAHIAAVLNVPLITTPYRKPDPRVVRGVEFEYPELVVVGDKVLTDGLLAYFLGARFFRVSRRSSVHEALSDKALSAVDDIVRHSCMLVRLLRPQQWIKNGLVFAPLFFSSHLFDARMLVPVTAAFIILCLLASAGYILNDYLDRDADALHPHKRNRPLASGEVAPLSAFVLASALVFGASWLCWIYVPTAVWILAGYFVSSLAYSGFIKQVPIIEIFGFIWFYLARVLAGSVAAGVLLSSWLTLAVIFLALFLISGKRYAERALGRSRAVLNKYPERFFEGMLFMSAGLVIVFYGVYSILGTTSPFAVYSSIPVTVAVVRYLHLVLHGEAGEYPEKLVFKDPGLLIAAAVWLACMAVIFY